MEFYISPQSGQFYINVLENQWLSVTYKYQNKDGELEAVSVRLTLDRSRTKIKYYVNILVIMTFL